MNESLDLTAPDDVHWLACECWKHHDDVVLLRERLEQVTAERDAWRAEVGLIRAVAEAAKAEVTRRTEQHEWALARLEQVQTAEVKSLRAALREYGQHKPDCATIVEEWIDYSGNYIPADCSCGLAEHLRDTEPAAARRSPEP